jgi:hypothetical protein
VILIILNVMYSLAVSDGMFIIVYWPLCNKIIHIHLARSIGNRHARNIMLLELGELQPKRNPWPLAGKQSILTDQPPLVGEI